MITDHDFRPGWDIWGLRKWWKCAECGEGPEFHERLAPYIEARREGKRRLL